MKKSLLQLSVCILMGVILLLAGPATVGKAAFKGELFKAAVQDIFDTYSAANIKGDVDLYISLWDKKRKSWGPIDLPEDRGRVTCEYQQVTTNVTGTWWHGPSFEISDAKLYDEGRNLLNKNYTGGWCWGHGQMTEGGRVGLIAWDPAEFRNVKITPIKKVPTAEYKIQVTQAGVTHTVKPIERAKSAKVFYNFRSDSAHTPFVENNVSKLYMYRDSTRGKLSLIIHHGKDNQPGGWFRVDFDFSGIPADAFVAVSDDQAHKWFHPVPQTHPEGQEFHLRYEPEGNWYTKHNTDGGVLSGLPIDKQWSIKIKPNFIKGITAITAWWYQTPKGVENIWLHMNKPVTISLVPTN